MSKTDTNLSYKVLKTISEQGVNSFNYLAKSLDVTEELLDFVMESLIEKGYMKYIDESEFQKEAAFKCRFCPFAMECSDKIPHIFYEISQKGKEMINLL